MNILSTIFNTQSTAHVKILSKALFSFLLVASFLASCTTDDATGIINNDGSTLTLDDCPEDSVTTVANVPFTWINPTGEITITSIAIATTGNTVNDALPVLETNSTNATLPEGSYTVTITAESTEDATVTGTCSFDVTVTSADTTPSLTCPSDGAGIVGATITWDEPISANLPEGVTLDISINPDATDISNTGATFSTTNVYTVTFTAMEGSTPFMVGDSALDCTFMVEITETADTTPPTITESTCEDITHMSDLPAGTTTLAISDLSPQPNITVTDDGSLTPEITYTPDPITSLSTGTSTNQITATATDASGNEAMCTFMVTVTVASANGGGEEMKPDNSAFFLLTNDAVPSADNPFLIHDTNDLAMLATVVNGNMMYSNINLDTPDGVQSNYRMANYQLASNIMVPEGGTGSTETVTENTSNFTPIGTGKAMRMDSALVTTCDNKCFEGTFDGSNYTISGLRLSHTNATENNSTNVGLFSVISGSTTSISNLILTDINISGNTMVGGLVGTMINSASLSNVSAEGSVSGSTATGGLVGRMESMSRITNAFASITVNSRTGQGGGLVGQMTSSSITNAFASGDVTGSLNLGGLVGNMFSSSSVINAYASGDVGSSTDNGNIGGLVGQLSLSSLTNTLAWGSVAGNPAGGLVANVTGTTMITNSYWDSNATMQDMSQGTGATGLDTTALKMPTMASQTSGETYFGWDQTSFTVDGTTVMIEAPWNFGTASDYPVFTKADGSVFPTVACQRDSTGQQDCSQ